ncbi:hypothetical protein PLICRDRAFT_52210 [Plicaturopsis crispa FD-325 SS-3]|nr:hypothetical protein PLICRDRAFT_52210 [Plicaturopsis crispa FD-325 SS-3]
MSFRGYRALKLGSWTQPLPRTGARFCFVLAFPNPVGSTTMHLAHWLAQRKEEGDNANGIPLELSRNGPRHSALRCLHRRVRGSECRKYHVLETSLLTGSHISVELLHEPTYRYTQAEYKQIC